MLCRGMYLKVKQVFVDLCFDVLCTSQVFVLLFNSYYPLTCFSPFRGFAFTFLSLFLESLNSRSEINMTDRVTYTTEYYLFSCPYDSGNETLFLFFEIVSY